MKKMIALVKVFFLTIFISITPVIADGAECGCTRSTATKQISYTYPCGANEESQGVRKETNVSTGTSSSSKLYVFEIIAICKN